MARSRYDWTQNKFERYVKEGRGKGRGKNYKPWITIQDFPSVGRASRSLFHPSDRIHHFMSDWELRFFYLPEWSDAVRDVNPWIYIAEVLALDRKGLAPPPFPVIS